MYEWRKMTHAQRQALLRGIAIAELQQRLKAMGAWLPNA